MGEKKTELFRDHYLDFSVLDKMDEYKRELVLYMYKKLIDVMIGEPSYIEKYVNIPHESRHLTNLHQSLNHLYNNLIEMGVLTDDIRELNINKIID